MGVGNCEVPWEVKEIFLLRFNAINYVCCTPNKPYEEPHTPPHSKRHKDVLATTVASQICNNAGTGHTRILSKFQPIVGLLLVCATACCRPVSDIPKTQTGRARWGGLVQDGARLCQGQPRGG